MAKSKETSVIAINPELQRNLDIISAFKEQVDVLGQNCQQIQIVDDTTLGIGQQNLSKANTMLTAIEAKRKAIKEPYLEAGRLVDSTAKSLTEELEKGIKHIKNQVGEWEKKRLAEEKAKQDEIDRQLAEKQALEAAEAARKQSIRDYIDNKATVALKNCYSKCTSVAECDNQVRFIEKNYKGADFFQEFAKEAFDLRDTYLDLIKTKREQLASADTMSEGELELAKKQEELALAQANLEAEKRALEAEKERIEAEKKAKEDAEAARLDKIALEEQAALNKTRGVRYTWGHELVDVKNVPTEWLVLNDALVKEWLKENKDVLKDGEVRLGIKFFKKMGISA